MFRITARRGQLVAIGTLSVLGLGIGASLLAGPAAADDPAPAPSVTVAMASNLDNATPLAPGIAPQQQGTLTVANHAAGATDLTNVGFQLQLSTPPAVGAYGTQVRLVLYCPGSGLAGCPVGATTATQLPTQPVWDGTIGSFTALLREASLPAGASWTFPVGIAFNAAGITGTVTLEASVAQLDGSGHPVGDPLASGSDSSALLKGVPSLALTLPSTIPTVSSITATDVLQPNGQLRVSNTGASAATLDHVLLSYTISGPASLQPSDIAFRLYCPADLTAGSSCDDNHPFLVWWKVQPGLGGSNGQFSGTILLCCGGPGALPAGYDETFPFALDVSSPDALGPLSMTVTLVQNSVTGGAQVPEIDRATSTASTTVAGPPVLAAAAPGAKVAKDYSFAFATAGTPAETVWHVYRDAPTGPVAVTPTVSADKHPIYALDDGLHFDATTGLITGAAASLVPDAHPVSYTLVANNGVAGATTANPSATPPVALHDVSAKVAIPVLFSDLPVDADFADSIYTLAKEGIIGGYSDGTFKPAQPTSRQAFSHYLAVFLKLAGETVPTGPCTSGSAPFPDVAKSQPFCSEIRYLAEHGMVKGYTDGKFHPATAISRQAMAALLYRVDRILNGVAPAKVMDARCTGSAPFKDVPVSSPFCGDIAWMHDRHISNGYTDGGYHPTTATSRAATSQFVTIFQRVENRA